MKVSKKLLVLVMVGLLAFGSVLSVSAAANECRHQYTHQEIRIEVLSTRTHPAGDGTCTVKRLGKFSDRRCDQCGVVFSTAYLGDAGERHSMVHP